MLTNSMRLAAGLAVILSAAGAALAGPTVGYLKIEGELPERERLAPFLFAKPGTMTFRGVIETLEGVATDGALDGVVIRLVEPQLSLSRVEEMGEAMRAIRAAGKKVHVFTEIYDQSAVVLGSYADGVIVQSGGAVMFTGLYAEEMFLKDTLTWAGVTPDFVQIGDYKGAKEMFANAGPSPEWDQNFNQLLDSLYANMTRQVREGRGVTAEQLDAAMRDGLSMEPEAAVGHRLADGVCDRMNLDAELKEAYGGEFAWDLSLGPSSHAPDFASMGLFEAFAEIMRAVESLKGGPSRDTIAVLHIDGPIVDGKSTSGSLLGGASVGSLTIREKLKEIEEDDLVKGVIVRVNSPGGSAIASESIWLGLRRVAERKPVWTSVGNMAASGGYYIAVAGDKIYVSPSSIVGSIGVVGGKLALAGLYEKLHIHVVPRVRGPMAGIFGALEPWTDVERAAITRSMKRTYEQFVSRVKAGRDGIDIAKTGEGRLFTGDKAIGLTMADMIGGLGVAIRDLAGELGLAEGSYDVLDYPRPMSLQEMLEEGFPGMGASADASAMVTLLRGALGDAAWSQVRDAVTAMLQLRKEPVLLAMPRAIVVR
jgi:protease-4